MTSRGRFFRGGKGTGLKLPVLEMGGLYSCGSG